MKNWYVYKVEFQTVLYLTEYNKLNNGDSRFSFNKTDAKLFTHMQAYKLARKLNQGLDSGTYLKYGWWNQ